MSLNLTMPLTYVINIPPSYGYTSSYPFAAANTIPTAIKDGSLQADLSLRGDSGATVTFYCLWADAGILETYLLTANNFTFGGYSCMFGAPHPIQTGFYCEHIHVRPVEPNTGVLTYRYAELECQYKPHVFDPGSPLLLKKYSFTPCGQVFQMPASTGANRFTVSGTAINNLQPVPNDYYVPFWRYAVTVYNVLTLPLSTVKTLERTVNDSPFTIKINPSSTVTMDKGTCLYEGITETERTVTNQGADRMTVTHQWTCGPIDQNKVPNWDLFTGTITDMFGTVWVLPDQLQYQYGDHTLLKV